MQTISIECKCGNRQSVRIFDLFKNPAGLTRCGGLLPDRSGHCGEWIANEKLIDAIRAGENSYPPLDESHGPLPQTAQEAMAAIRKEFDDLREGRSGKPSE